MRPQLEHRKPKDGPGWWHGHWEEERVALAVLGDEDGPYPEHARTLWDIVDRFAEMKRAIEAYAAALPPDTEIPLASPTPASLDARSCEFREGTFHYTRIAVLDPDAPTRATVDFATEQPDPYLHFAATLDSGRPVAIAAMIT